MRIGEAARRAGLTVKTVRYYSNIGMVTPRQHAATGYRDYGEGDDADIRVIAHCLHRQPGASRRFADLHDMPSSLISRFFGSGLYLPPGGRIT